jgi:hypothetical protein
MPQNVEAERSILGAILLDNNAINAAIEKVKPEDFFHDHHRKIYRQMIALAEAQKPIDLVTLTEQLQCSGELESVGGAAYVSELIDGVPHSTNVEHYARIVKEKSLLRGLIHATSAIQQQALDAEDDADTILERAREALTNIEGSVSKKAPVTVYTLTELNALAANPIDYLVYPFAIRGLISLVDGAAKAAGKTTLNLTGAAASLHGNLFLNRPTQRARILYTTEENIRTFRMATARAGLTSEPNFHILPFCSFAGLPWSQIVRHIEQKCVELKIDWLIVDTFYAIAGLGGEAENQAGSVDAAIAPLRSIVGRLDIALTLDRHCRKSAGPIGESGRGSTALTGAADSIIELKRLAGTLYPERRQLEITGRVEQVRMEIELRDGLYIISPDTDVDNSIGETERLAAAIAADPKASKRKLEEDTGVGRNRQEKIAGKSGWLFSESGWVRGGS